MMPPLRALPLAGLAAVSLATLLACEGPVDTKTALVKGGPVVDPTLLVSPADGGTFAQNDPSIGCPAHPQRGYGFRTRFDWKDVGGASGYQVVFQHEGSAHPAVVRFVTSSEYAETRCNAFVADQNLEHWTWTVYALGPATGPFTGDSASMPRDTIISSSTREYRFAPCRLSDGRACYAPPADTAPASP